VIYTVTLNPVIDKTLVVYEIVDNQVLRAVNVRLDLGGKGINVSRALQMFSCDSFAMGFLGGTSGEYINRGLNALGIQNYFIFVKGETRTNIVITELNSDKHIKVNEPGPIILEEDLEKLKLEISKRVTAGDYWLFCGNLPPGVPQDIYKILIQLVQDKGARAILDTSGEALKLGCLANPYMIKPNKTEVESLIGYSIANNRDLVEVAQTIINNYAVQYVAISLGAEGLYLATPNDQIWVKPPEIKIVGLVGVGDALLAGLVWSVKKGCNLMDMACWATSSGSAAACHEGVEMGSFPEIENLFRLIKKQAVSLND
jgi:1-phosphofructokinase